MKIVRENINFERGQDNPLISLNIGRSSKRSFKNIEEAAQWYYEFPQICTEGELKKWPNKVSYNKSYYKENEEIGFLNFSIPGIESLRIVKWIKNNLTLEDRDYMGLREAKDIWDKLKEIIKNNI